MKSLHKVLDIIEIIAKHGSVGIQAIAAVTGYPPSTVHRILATLAERNYVRQDPATKSYRLSLKFLELGTRARQDMDLTSVARPHLEQLKTTTKENANLAILDGRDVIYIDQVRGDYMLQLFTQLGARAPLYCTGVGKLFLSQWNNEAVKDYLNQTPMVRHTDNTLASAADLIPELTMIRQQGYAVDNEEMEYGVRCVAALIADHDGQPAGAVSVSGATMRITPERIPQLGLLVGECAQAISEAMGYTNHNHPQRTFS